MEKRNKSLTEFSEELGISRTALYEYLRGRGNPSVETLEHIAEKLSVSPAVLMTGLFDLDRREITLLLLDTIHEVAELPEKKRLRFPECLCLLQRRHDTAPEIFFRSVHSAAAPWKGNIRRSATAAASG